MAVLLTGCASNVVVNNDELLKFDGGSITKTEAYQQMIATAKYDTSFSFVKRILTEVDMQLLAKDATYTGKVSEENITKEYNEFVTNSGGADKAFEAITQQTGIKVTKEEEAKKLIRHQRLVESVVLDLGVKEDEILSAYAQQYGEKINANFISVADKAQAIALKTELSNGTIKLDTLKEEFKKFSEAQQSATQKGTKFVYNQYTIEGIGDTAQQSITRKMGVFSDEDEAKLFDQQNNEKWLDPFQLKTQNAQSGQAQPYFVMMPYGYQAPQKALDDTVKLEIRTLLGQNKLQDAKNVEKVMREYRKSKGFEIKDAHLKEAFDAYEVNVDTEEKSAQSPQAV